MASDPRTMEGPCNSGTDEETVAFRKKRLRRVSFADVEITSVHVFDRDEDLETPPTDALTKNQTPEDAHEPRNEVLGFFKELADGDDLHEASFNGDEVEDEDEAACASKSFLRPFESPGSSVPGSATSNDGDEFFGPVSANFIRPSRLSDSGASNDNHEVTMDSTAFSMHFRSLIRSESGDLRTPTNVGSGFGEKTPSNMTTPTDPESLMTLTKATKLQLFSDPEDKSTGYKYSDTMSLVGENARSYDYGKLSPNLEAILVEGSKELHCVSVPDCTSSNILKRNESPLKYENGSRHVNQSGYGDKALVRVCALDESAQTEFTDLPEAASHGNQKNNAIHSPSRNDCFPTDLSSHEPVESLIHLAELKTPDQQRQKGSLLIKESRRSAEIVSSVRQSGSRLKETIEKSKLLLSELNSSIHARVSPLKENSNNVTSVPVANLEEHFSAVDTKSIHDQSTNYMQNELSGSLTCIGNFSKMEGSNFLAENEEYLLHMSPSRVFKANPTQPVSEPSEILSLKLKMDHESDAKSTDARDKFASPPTKRPAHKFPFEENSSSLPRHLNQQLTDLATIDLDQDASLMDATVRNSHTTGIANELESWFNESSANSRSPISPCKEALITSQTREEAEMILLSDPEFHGGKLSERHVGVQNSGSPSILREVEDCSLRKRKGEIEREDASRSSRIKLDGILSPNCNTNELSKGNKPFHISHSPVVASDIDSSHICEKRNKEKLEGVRSTCMVGSPNTQATNGPCLDVRLDVADGCNEVRVIGGDITMKHWSDISQKLSADTRDLISPSVNSLKINSIHMIQDILAHLQKLKIRGIFFMQLQQKRRNILSIAVQESQMLKSAKALCLPVSSFHSKDKASHEKLVASRHEFEALQEKLKNLTQHFRGYCKIGGDTGCSEIIEMLNDQLNKKISFRFLHEGIQLYEVQHLENRNGVISIVLSYLDFFSQRFTISSAQIPSLSLSIKLNEAKIMTKFANMGACAAFAYVLNGDTTKKYAGSRSLAQETIRTSLVLQNLLDVVQEVQIARIESTNLVDASFSSSGIEQLDLQLCFVDVGSHTKMNLVFDMTCLKHGVYPSEILPNRIQVSGGGRQKAHIKSLPAQAKASVDGLRVGYLRIIRICRCISQMMSL
ncbi:hypothetical protein LINPERPRIM_LOCUS29870 [Linum perenne]